MDIFSMVGIAVLGAALALTVRAFRPELAMLIGIATGTLLLLLSVGELSGLLDALGALSARYGLDTSLIGVLLKIVGIAYLAQFGAQICKDAGEGAIAAKVELCGRVLILSLSLPTGIAAIRAATELIAGTLP